MGHADVLLRANEYKQKVHTTHCINMRRLKYEYVIILHLSHWLLLISILCLVEASRIKRSLDMTYESGVSSQVPAEIEINKELLDRKGGISGTDKASLIIFNRVYFAKNLRPLVCEAGKYKPDFNYGPVGVCEGHITGADLQNTARTFAYFACPVDETQASNVVSFQGIRHSGRSMFCCRSPPNQGCCSLDTFVLIHGTPKKSSTLALKLIGLIVGLVSALLFAGCLCLIICLCVVLPNRRKKQQQQQQRGGKMPYAATGSSVSTPLMSQQQQVPVYQQQPAPYPLAAPYPINGKPAAYPPAANQQPTAAPYTLPPAANQPQPPAYSTPPSSEKKDSRVN